MISYTVPGEVIVSGFAILVVAGVYVALAVARLQEQVARLEEWVRLHERQN